MAHDMDLEIAFEYIQFFQNKVWRISDTVVTILTIVTIALNKMSVIKVCQTFRRMYFLFLLPGAKNEMWKWTEITTCFILVW